MYNNILTYICFFVLCGLVVLDMWFCSSVVLQMVCILLVVCVVSLGVWVAVKHAKGTYYTTEQAHNLQSYLSENIALNAQIKALGVDVQKAKKLALSSPELQNTIVQNRRLIAQISNLQTRVEQLTELLQTAKNAKETAVVPIAAPEQMPLKKAK